MNTLLAHKQTEEQKKSNEFVKFQFILAMMNMDERMFSTLLREDLLYMGCLNKWQFMHWLKSQFLKFDSQSFNSTFIEGIALDYYPAACSFEFSYTVVNNNNLNNPFDANQEYKAINCKAELKLVLVLHFEDGKIVDIRSPRKFLPLEDLTRLSQQN